MASEFSVGMILHEVFNFCEFCFKCFSGWLLWNNYSEESRHYSMEPI